MTHTVETGKAGRGWRVSQVVGRHTLSGVVREDLSEVISEQRTK